MTVLHFENTETKEKTDVAYCNFSSMMNYSCNELTDGIIFTITIQNGELVVSLDDQSLKRLQEIFNVDYWIKYVKEIVEDCDVLEDFDGRKLLLIIRDT